MVVSSVFVNTNTPPASAELVTCGTQPLGVRPKELSRA